MSIQALRLSMAVLLMAATSLARAADAAPTATDAEKSYLTLRNSKDRKSQLLAERWYSLVQLQEWSDTSGKFKTTAKYVEQDEKQGTVKIRVIKGTGIDQVVKDRTIAVDKLSKECQSRVKQIAFLADKVDEAAKAEVEKASKPKDGPEAMAGMAGPPPDERGRGGDRMAAMDRGPPPENGSRPPRDPRNRKGRQDPARVAAGGDETSQADSAGDSPMPQGTIPQRAAPQSAMPDRGAPPPLVIPPLPGAAESRPAISPDAAATPPAPDAKSDVAAGDPRRGPRPVQPANLPDQQPWRTSFEAFRANLTAEASRAGWQLGWGELTALKQAHDQATAAAVDANGREIPPAAASLDSLGDFAWEATLSQQPDEQIDWSKALSLTLPEPFRFICQLDQERGPGEYRRFFPGDHVKFVGRFVGFEGDSGIQIAIRFPDDVPAPVPMRPDQRR